MILALGLMCIGGLVAYFVIRDAVRAGVRQALKDHQLWVNGHAHSGEADRR
jgi:hypothetical protein